SQSDHSVVASLPFMRWEASAGQEKFNRWLDKFEATQFDRFSELVAEIKTDIGTGRCAQSEDHTKSFRNVSCCAWQTRDRGFHSEYLRIGSEKRSLSWIFLARTPSPTQECFGPLPKNELRTCQSICNPCRQ